MSDDHWGAVREEWDSLGALRTRSARPCGGCGKSFPDPGPPPVAEDGSVPMFLCFGCSVSFAAHERLAGREHPFTDNEPGGDES